MNDAAEECKLTKRGFFLLIGDIDVYVKFESLFFEHQVGGKTVHPGLAR